jgi:hypothetical protein
MLLGILQKFRNWFDLVWIHYAKSIKEKEKQKMKKRIRTKKRESQSLGRARGPKPGSSPAPASPPVHLLSLPILVFLFHH